MCSCVRGEMRGLGVDCAPAHAALPSVEMAVAPGVAACACLLDRVGALRGRLAVGEAAQRGK